MTGSTTIPNHHDVFFVINWVEGFSSDPINQLTLEENEQPTFLTFNELNATLLEFQARNKKNSYFKTSIFYIVPNTHTWLTEYADYINYGFSKNFEDTHTAFTLERIMICDTPEFKNLAHFIETYEANEVKALFTDEIKNMLSQNDVKKKSIAETYKILLLNNNGLKLNQQNNDTIEKKLTNEIIENYSLAQSIDLDELPYGALTIDEISLVLATDELTFRKDKQKKLESIINQPLDGKIAINTVMELIKTHTMTIMKDSIRLNNQLIEKNNMTIDDTIDLITNIDVYSKKQMNDQLMVFFPPE